MDKVSKYIIITLLCISVKLYAQNSNIVPGNIIVMLNTESDLAYIVNEYKSISGVSTKLHHTQTLSASMKIHLLGFDSNVIDQYAMLSTLQLDPTIKIAQFNHWVEERYTPDDTQFSNQWNMSNTGQNGGLSGADIDAVNAWNISTGGLTSSGDTIVVAVIDGGFDLTHEDINYWKNYSEIPNNGIDDDNNGYIDDFDGWNSDTDDDNHPVITHGTHISGIIGAKGNNNLGVAGINWGVKIMPISIDENSVDPAYESNIVEAYSYIMEQRRLYNQTNGTKGAFVVSTNSSFGVNLGQPAAFPLWCAMYDSLGSVGILNAGATANSNTDVDAVGDMPSACPSDWFISVTNTNNTDTKPNAGFGATTIDMSAPGTGIISTTLSNNYSALSGTSMASPHVAGAIALMYAVNCSQLITDYKNDPAGFSLMIKDSLLGATDPIAALSGITVTGGRLNLYKSVKSIQNHYPNDICPEVDTTKGIGVEEISTAMNRITINNVYPNPAKNKIWVNYNNPEKGKAILILTNSLGSEVLSASKNNTSLVSQEMSLDISSLSNGVYYLHLSSESEISNTVKLIIF